jgi:hypothetical protein
MEVEKQFVPDAYGDKRIPEQVAGPVLLRVSTSLILPTNKSYFFSRCEASLDK